MDILLGLFFVTLAAVLGGIIGKIFKLPPLVGYIISGIFFGALLPPSFKSISSLAEFGTVLLMFSIGVELSLDSLTKFVKIAVFGGLIQIILVSLLSYFLLIIFKIPLSTSLVLSLGFSVSSTAVVVKLLSDRGEIDTIHGGIMLAWLLVQDLAVIPIMVILPVIGSTSGGIFLSLGAALLKAFAVVAFVVVLGKLIIPKLIHLIAEVNSRELLLMASVSLALGTAVISSLLGISPALGAFLAGVVISESQEHHAIFAETRPLRDLFVALFFVTLGFLINPTVLITKLPFILIITVLIMIVKMIVVFTVCTIFGYRGKTSIATSFGLSQIGEFAFVIFSVALTLKLISPYDFSLGIGITLITLILTPILYGLVIPFWRKVKFINIFKSIEKNIALETEYKNHIIICGYGRVGKWVGKALNDYKIPFVVVEYNQKIVQDLKAENTPVIYGDPTEPEVLEAVNMREAKAVVIAIPDRVAQETIITYIQTVAPGVKIISRAHLDTDWEKLKNLRVNKIVQPEFEASLEIVRSILRGIGKTKDEISGSIKNLRVLHSK